jgi:hypothetical protein
LQPIITIRARLKSIFSLCAARGVDYEGIDCPMYNHTTFIHNEPMARYRESERDESTLILIKRELKQKINVGICIAPTEPFRAALGAESRVCYPGNTTDRQTQ